MKAKGSPKRLLCLRREEPQMELEHKGSKKDVSKEKSGTEKAHDVLGNVGNILKGVL